MLAPQQTTDTLTKLEAVLARLAALGAMPRHTAAAQCSHRAAVVHSTKQPAAIAVDTPTCKPAAATLLTSARVVLRTRILLRIHPLAHQKEEGADGTLHGFRQKINWLVKTPWEASDDDNKLPLKHAGCLTLFKTKAKARRKLPLTTAVDNHNTHGCHR